MIWHSTPQEEVLKELGVDANNGLANCVVDERVFELGRNIFTKNDRATFMQQFLSQLKSKIIIVLIISNKF